MFLTQGRQDVALLSLFISLSSEGFARDLCTGISTIVNKSYGLLCHVHQTKAEIANNNIFLLSILSLHLF